MVMGKFLKCAELYMAIQALSSQTKETLWVSSRQLGTDAHTIFSQEILKHPATDIRFVFPLNEESVKRSDIDPHEVQFLKEHLKEDAVKTCDLVHSNIFVFDNQALVTSADLTKAAFENNPEVGVTVEGEELAAVKNFFAEVLWKNTKPVGDLKGYKKIWNLNQKKHVKKPQRRVKVVAHTSIVDWSDEDVNTWYIGVPQQFPARAIQAVRKETNWGNSLQVVGDVGYSAFKELKTGDLTYLADVYKQRGKIVIQKLRVYDKSKVETDDGDFHLACHILKNYTLERNQFFELLKNLNIRSRSLDVKLSAEQLKVISESLLSIKPKRKRKNLKASIKINLVRAQKS
jgi:hypothetical protein